MEYPEILHPNIATKELINEIAVFVIAPNGEHGDIKPSFAFDVEREFAERADVSRGFDYIAVPTAHREMTVRRTSASSGGSKAWAKIRGPY
jgi:hypothetical protein